GSIQPLRGWKTVPALRVPGVRCATPGCAIRPLRGRAEPPAGSREQASFTLSFRVLLAPHREPLQHRLAPAAVPRIAVAALGFNLRQVVLDHAVAAAEDGLVSADLVEPRPQGRRRRVLHHHAVPIFLDNLDTGEL